MRTLGIVGGLGTETSCSFCLSVNTKINQTHKVQPSIVMDNLPVPLEVLESIMHGNHSEEMQQLLKNSVQRLNTVGAEAIVIPCNTVHIFIDELRKISKAPIFSIIEETAEECTRRKHKKVGLLASTTTVKQKLYAEQLSKKGIELLVPNEEEQNFISDCIVKIVTLSLSEEDRLQMIKIGDHLVQRGAEAIILGCTDLFLAIKQSEAGVPIINSTEVLENSAIRWLIENEE